MDPLDWLVEPLRSGLVRRALAEVALIGAICGALGFWVVSFRLSYPVESLSHGLLPGLVLAALAGVPLVVGAGAGVVLAVVLIVLATRDARVGPDSATAVVVTGLVGLGALLALTPQAPARLSELLFGDILGVSGGDLALTAVLAVVGVLVLLVLHRPLAAVAFDPGGARLLGLRTGSVMLALLLLLAAAIAVAVQSLGALLVLAVMVAPGVAVTRLGATPARAIVVAGAGAALTGVLGVYCAHHLGTAAGASVALALCLPLLATWGPRRPRRAAAPARHGAG